MLILSIVLAAMAPVMTTRNKTDQSSPWRYSEGNLSDAYYGLGESQTAMIGQREFENTDETAKLIINSSGTRPSQISFKRDSNNVGVLRLNNEAILLGSLRNGTNLGASSTAVGIEVQSTDTNVAIGYRAKASAKAATAVGGETQSGNSAEATDEWASAYGSASRASGSNSTALGAESYARQNNSTALGAWSVASGELSTAVGYNSSASGKGSIALGGGGALEQPTAEANGSVAIGYALSSGSNALAIAPGGIGSSLDSRTRATGSSSIALGGNSQSTKDYTIAVGVSSRSIEEYAMAIGTLANAGAEKALAIGRSASANNETSIAIGNSSSTTNTDAIAIGNGVTASGESSIAIGSAAGVATTTASGEKAIAIGDGAVATGSASIALGNYAEAKGNNNIAIGNNACKNMKGNNKICIGSFSGSNASEHQNDDVERIYIGGESKLNKGSAVLEVHNDSSKRGGFSNTAVVIHGNLVVNGLIFSSNSRNGSHFEYQSRGDDNGHTGHVIHFVDNNDNIKNYYRNGTVDERKISDSRLKYVGKEFSSGLDKIRELKVYNYTFKKDTAKEPHVGVIAQDLQKIFPDAVTKGKDGFLRIRMEDMFYAVINAIKELDAKVSAQDKKIKELEARIEKLESKIK